MKKFLAVAVVVATMVCGASTLEINAADAAAPAKKTAVKRKPAAKRTPAKKNQTKFTTVASFVKACGMTGDVTLGSREGTACYDTTKRLVIPGMDMDVCGAISFGGNISNPDYLIEERGNCVALLNAKTYEVEYLSSDLEMQPERMGGRMIGMSVMAEKMYKFVNYTKTGSPMEFMLSVQFD